MKYRMGLFDMPNTNIKDYPKYGSAEHFKAAQDAAVQTMVLLKNNDDLAFVGNDDKRHLEPGEFLLQIADKSLRVNCR